jgi:hypothetical protein
MVSDCILQFVSPWHPARCSALRTTRSHFWTLRGPRLNCWVALNGQKVQYSGAARPDAVTAKANDATHLAGQLAIDDTAADAPKVTATFDVTLAKDFKVAH